jgi:hypothetical protein
MDGLVIDHEWALIHTNVRTGNVARMPVAGLCEAGGRGGLGIQTRPHRGHLQAMRVLVGGIPGPTGRSGQFFPLRKALAVAEYRERR